ncbi:MAG TPA: glycosyltransferase family 4 protein [Firmicutes bacterium]|nr:glycosyltransferase family 4 protein [Bacillota bacterium]
MRLLHIVGDSKFGGGFIVISQLAGVANSLGWDVEVLATDPTVRAVLARLGIPVVNQEVIWREIRPVRDCLGLLKLTGFLRQAGYDIVHTHTSKAGFVGRLAAWRAGVPVIVHTAHGFAFHEASSPAAVRFFASLERMAAKWCHCVVTVSEFHRDWALRLGIGGPSRVIAIPNGIPEARVASRRSREAVRSEWGVPNGAKVILAIGRLAKQKGLEYLLLALPQVLQRTDVALRVVIAGEGSLRSDLENMSRRLQIESQVSFLGLQEGVGDLLNAADFVVLPSLREGLSIALLEAMAAGKPIITTSIGSNMEVTRNGEAALLVPPGDPAALTNAVCHLLEHPDVARLLAERARERYLCHYTEERMMNAYRDLYTSLVAKGTSLVTAAQ